MIYVHNTFAKTKPSDTTVNYETWLYFTLQNNKNILSKVQLIIYEPLKL